MEELDSDATHAWVAKEAQLTDRYLAALPGRDRLRSRLTKLYNYERFGVPFQAHGRYFYTRNSGLQNQSVLYVTAAPAAPPLRETQANPKGKGRTKKASGDH